MLPQIHTQQRATVCALLIGVLTLNGCASQRSSSTPSQTPSASSSTRTESAPDALPSGYVKSYVVFGKRYYVLGSSTGFRQTGLASWYGPKFHGRKTANGEIYDMHQMTAAHKNLPLPTFVKVTNLANQRSIVVRVNDRGPFIGERIIDLSHAAALKLDLIGPGTGQVEVIALNESEVRREMPRMPPGQPRSRPSRSSSPGVLIHGNTPSASRNGPGSNLSSPAESGHGLSGSGGFVQVASFGSNNNAVAMQRQLEQSGFNSVIIQSVQLDGRLLHRVKLGPFATANEQAEALRKVHAIGLDTARAVSQ